MRPLFGVAFLLFFVACAAHAAVADDSQTPFTTPFFTITPSTAPSYKIDGTVIRAGRSLPIALVPFLIDRDDVTIRLTPFENQVNRYHANVGFVHLGAGGAEWLFQPNKCDDELFNDNGRPECPNHVPQALHFVYGEKQATGIPIVLIVPEDHKAGDLDPGARNYVEKNLTAFVTMAITSNDATDKYTWFESFLNGLASGNFDNDSGRSRVEGMAAALGASPDAVKGCYTNNPGNKTAVTDCIKKLIDTAGSPNGFSNDQSANLLGVGLGSIPISISGFNVAPFVGLAADVLKLFVAKKEKYRYVPAPLYPSQIGTSGVDVNSMIDPVTVPGVRPNAAISDALFFTIGKGDSATDRPAVLADADAAKEIVSCAALAQVAIPFHLDKTSMYVHDATVTIRPTQGKFSPQVIALDPRLVTNPIIPVFRDPATPALKALDYIDQPSYRVSMTAGYGFDTVKQSVVQDATIVVPHHNVWNLDSPPLVSGATVAARIASASMPCLDRVDLVQGGTRVTLPAADPIDATRKKLNIDLSKFTNGSVAVEFIQEDKIHHVSVVDRATLKIHPAATVTAPVAYLDDSVLRLAGSGFDLNTRVAINGAFYSRAATSTATDACYVGPSIVNFGVGSAAPAIFYYSSGAAGPPFGITIGDARPRISSVAPPTVRPQRLFTGAPTGTILSTDYLIMSVTPSSLPSNPGISVRQKPNKDGGPCDALKGVSTVSTAQPAIVANTLTATLRPVDLLTVRSAGTIQVAVRDNDTGAISDWVDVPGTSIVNVPDISSLTCDQSTCTMKGAYFNLIQSITDGVGQDVITRLNCKVAPADPDCMTFAITNPPSALKVTILGVPFPLAISVDAVKKAQQTPPK